VKLVIIHQEARAELDAGMAYYESKRKGLGLEFRAEVQRAIVAIQSTPQMWPPYKKTDFRKFQVHRFPFLVFYLELPEVIWIATIAHGSRRPGYWKTRTYGV